MIQSSRAKEVKFIIVKDIIENQNQGRLDFSISDKSLSRVVLSAVHVDYKNAQKYTWSGNSTDGLFAATFIKDKNGYSGNLYDYAQNTTYLIYPITTTVAAMIKYENQETDHIECCDNPSRCCDEPEPPGGWLSGNCENNCPGHIDILFLLTPEVQEWMFEESLNNTFLGLLVAELELTFANSNITHTVDFHWDESDWEWDGEVGPMEIPCQAELNAFANDPQTKAQRKEFKADIVVLLTLGNWIEANGNLNFLDGCVPSGFENPGENNGFSAMRIEQLMGNPLFRHEIGHVFGAMHEWDSKPIPNFGEPGVPICEFAYDFTVEGKKYFTSVVGGGFGNILHYSDPNVNFLGHPTGTPLGQIGPTGLDLPARNNAGKIRATGCVISAFMESPEVNANIIASTDNCLLNLSASIQPFNDSYEFQWSWSFDGIFTESFPGESLGATSDIVVQDPVEDPCLSYFILLEVFIGGTLVESEVIPFDGGICTDNVQCPPPSKRKEIEQKTSAANIFDSNEKYVYNIYGQLIKKFNSSASFETISNDIKNIHSGVYIIVSYDKNGQPIARKFISLD